MGNTTENTFKANLLKTLLHCIIFIRLRAISPCQFMVDFVLIKANTFCLSKWSRDLCFQALTPDTCIGHFTWYYIVTKKVICEQCLLNTNIRASRKGHERHKALSDMRKIFQYLHRVSYDSYIVQISFPNQRYLWFALIDFITLYVCRVSFFLANFLRPLPDISNDDNTYMLRLIFMKLNHNDVWLCPQIMHDLWPWSRSHGGKRCQKFIFTKKSFNSSTIRMMVMLLIHMTDLDIRNKSCRLRKKNIWGHLGPLGSKSSFSLQML